MPTLHYLNADFDLGLRPGWTRPEAGQLARQLDELTLQWLLLGVDGDSVMVRERVPEDFLEAMADAGLEVPRTTPWPHPPTEARLAPLGWSTETEELAGRCGQPSEHPALEVIRRVNGRSFAARLERRRLSDRTALAHVHTVVEVEDLLLGADPAPGGWLFKSEHGNAGLGNHRLRRPSLGAADRRRLEQLLAEDAGGVVEIWRDRVVDLCTTFDLSPAGVVCDLELHEVVATAEGAFLGALFATDSPVVEPWRTQLEGVAGVVAVSLHRAGYFGPVCLDSFAWRDEGGRQHLRPLADLNARRHVSAAALRAWRRWDRRRALYWRFFSTRKLRLPTDARAVGAALGDVAWNGTRRRGVLLTSPPSLAGGRSGRRRPVKTSAALVGASRGEVLALDRIVRERLER